MANGKNGNSKFTDKQRVFIENYLRCWNAAESARLAGYSQRNSDVVGPRLLVNVGIRAEIDKRLAEYGMGANEVLARLATMARGDVSVFLTIDGDIDFTTEQAKAHSYLLKKARVKRGVTKTGEPWTETEIELHDPQSALVHIGRHLKLFTDKLEVDTKVTGALKVEAVDYNTAIAALAPRSMGDSESSG